MFVLFALVGLVPGVLMIIGLVSVWRAGIRYGARRERRRKR